MKLQFECVKKLAGRIAVVWIILLAAVHGNAMALRPGAPPDAAYTISDMSLQGAIEGENVVFTLAFKADIHVSGCRLPLPSGGIAVRDTNFPRGWALGHDGDEYFLTAPSRGRYTAELTFAGRSEKHGDWRRTRFRLPVAAIRTVAVQCDRDDLEVRFPGALRAAREKTPQGDTLIRAFLGVAEYFEMEWKPEIRKLEAERVVECEVNAIASAGVGVLHLDTVLSYRVVQGEMRKLAITLPPSVNVTQVRGDDIQDWSIDRRENEPPLLTVALSRPKDQFYRLQVNAELVLPEFPCRFDLPALIPEDVIRANGFLAVGTDSAIKIVVHQAAGLTQMDQAAFSTVTLGDAPDQARTLPPRTPFAYQFANLPFTLNLEADDVMTTLGVDERLVLAIKDNDAVFQAAVELDIRDAPAREIALETSADWMVAGVTGAEIADYDVRDAGAARVIRVYFRNAVEGRVLLDVRMEKTLPDGATLLAVPHFRVLDARSERGHLVLAGEQGLRLKAETTSGLIEVHTGSTPMRVPDAQLAFRFKDAEWSATVGLERTLPVVHSEIFHLVTMGEGVIYGCALVTYHVGGAPSREFKLVIPSECRNVEFSGRDLRNWEIATSCRRRTPCW
ncbi:MAG: hypothetical protein LC725_09550 [Lentisphaerae bacterium]|nr:hypothetical protein [Lentisphaerota bacterium]